MKKVLFYLAALVGVATVSCRKIEEDGQIVVVNNNSGTNNPTTGQTITLRGRIDKDTILRKGNNYIIDGLVYMVNNATMRIEPGVTVKANFQGANVGALVITRGAKLVADGTVNEPIVFSSANPRPRSGDWGGVVICGRASINTTFNGQQGVYQVEGGINNSFGDGLAGGGTAPNDDDSSGVLRYVRIEYAGYAFNPDQEINSLTMAAVGRKTVIDYVQVTYAKDDAFEWFGGTVDCQHLIAWKTQDDDFDSDNGFSGRVQFGLIFRDSAIADISRSEAFESDNDANGSTNAPQTRAVFSNITAIGPRATLTNVGNSLYLAAAQIRRNSGISIFNSIFIGWPTGLLIDASRGRVLDLNVQDSTVRFKNNIIAGCNTPYAYTASATPTGWNNQSVQDWFSNTFFANQTITTADGARLIAPFNYSQPDPTPFGVSGSPASGASFADPKLVGFRAVSFRGGVAAAGADQTWWKGWTSFPTE
ncbi:MAG TPA: hypothetical protein DCQ29_02495 [Chitinophagaceae bacterium]|nr:hypothetical protein [Chitinophagaceae bacterium]